MMGTKDHPLPPPTTQRAYDPARQLWLSSGKIISRNGKEIVKRKEETYKQDLKEVSGQLEGSACSFGTSSISLTSKTYHTHMPTHTNMVSSADSRW